MEFPVYPSRPKASPRVSAEHIQVCPQVDSLRDKPWQPMGLLGRSRFTADRDREVSKQQFCPTVGRVVWNADGSSDFHWVSHGGLTGLARNSPANLLTTPQKAPALLEDRGDGPSPWEEPGRPMKDNTVSSAATRGEKVLSQAEVEVTEH